MYPATTLGRAETQFPSLAKLEGNAGTLRNIFIRNVYCSSSRTPEAIIGF